MGTPRYRGNGLRRERELARGSRRERRGSAPDRRVSAVALTLIAILVTAGCRAKKTVVKPAPPAQEVDFTLIDSPSLQFLPRHLEAKTWRLEEDPLVVPGDRIGTYMGSAAESYLRYEVIDLTAGKYAEVGGAGFATVEIFRFPDFVKSFGAYSLRKDAARGYVPIQNEAYVSKFAVHVWRGPFYVRVTGGARNASQSLTQLASLVAERMPTAPAKPAVFGFFPADHRVPNSERYSADDGFGQKLLSNSFQVRFNVDGDEVDGLIIPSASKGTAMRILDAYRQLYIRNGRLLDPVPDLGEDNFTGEDRYLGRTIAFRIDRFVIAFNGYKDRQKLIDVALATNARIVSSIRRHVAASEDGTSAAMATGGPR